MECGIVLFQKVDRRTQCLKRTGAGGRPARAATSTEASASARRDGRAVFSGRLKRTERRAARESREADENTADPEVGQPGTKRLTEKYGDALLCVRFRYDAAARQRLKTVELIVEKEEWAPPPPRYTAEALVPLKINIADIRARQQAKTAGGRWNPEKQLWFVKYGSIEGTTLEKHILIDTF